MVIIYGLGNNEDKYINTKHNVGRLIVEYLAKTQNLTFTKIKSVMVAKFNDIHFVYSLDYMNTSGRFLNEYISFVKPNNLQLYVIQDDSDQNILNSKILLGGGSAGHNGIIDIYKYCLNWNINLNDIVRIKVGIRPTLNREKSMTFVLSKINKDEQDYIETIGNNISKNIRLIETNDVAKLQNIVNTKTVIPLDKRVD
jgi:peptidyl-tRNA hydrolase, PTH1 family